MPGFSEGFKEFVFKEIQKESDDAAKSLREPGPLTFSRQQVVSFSPESYHEKLSTEAPLLMAALTGACSKQKITDIKVSTAQHSTTSKFPLSALRLLVSAARAAWWT